MSCPYCLTPVYKDEYDGWYFECVNYNCSKSFCSRCSAKRSPIQAHGNHYHRPDCAFYEAKVDKST